MDKLTTIELGDEHLIQLARLVAEEQKRDQLQASGHRCWLFVPTPTEYERMKKFSEPPHYDRCPKCGKGRVVLEVYHGNISSALHAKCYWGAAGCGFKAYLSDDE